MLACPKCGSRLLRARTPHGFVHACARCGGRMVATAVLREEGSAREFLNDAWLGARDEGARRGPACPRCRRPMAQVDAPGRTGAPVTVDVCSLCGSIWFDPGEYAEVPRQAIEPSAAGEPELSPEARRAAAVATVRSMQRRQEEELGAEAPVSSWQYLPAILGFPVEIRAPELGSRPWMTWAVALAAVAVFATTFTGNLDAAVTGWGFIPRDWTRHRGLTIVSSFFLHAGLLHVLGNVYFLVVFGDNVEDDLGAARFALLLLSAHFVGLVAHGVFDPHSTLPLVGASAGVSGVVVYYAMAFPRAKLGLFFWIFFYPKWISFTARTALALWIGLQLLGSWEQVAGFSNVSALAHLGGGAVGLVAALAARRGGAAKAERAGYQRDPYQR